MNVLRGYVATALVLAFGGATAAEGDAFAGKAAVDRVVEAAHRAGTFDGMLLVGRGDAVAYERAIGLADREAGRAHRVDDTWRWASVSKQVAAVIAMQDVQAGRLSLDAPIATYLPGFAAPNAARITPRQLLQHTSGLPNPDDTPQDANGVPAFYTAGFARKSETPVDAALRYCAGPPKAAPGERFDYDNCDTLVLQAILEKLNRKPYAALLDERIARPLGLASLGISGDRARRAPRTAVGYVEGGREPVIDHAAFGAGGALYGTAQDLWRFDRALMQGKLLDPQARKTLWTGEPKLGYVALGAWSFEAQLAGCDGAVALVERRGAIGGVQVRNLIAPDLQAALIVFVNTDATVFGELWQGTGLGHDLASAAFCAAPRAVAPAR